LVMVSPPSLSLPLKGGGDCVDLAASFERQCFFTSPLEGEVGNAHALPGGGM
jgi:hypothetical protein